MSDISLSQLLEAGVHFGHKAYRWNPKMFPYIYSEVNNIHILDLVQSATLLKDANNYLESEASRGKTFLFVGTKRQASTLIAQEAKRCDSFYVNHRWLGGMLTNWSTLKERIKHLKDLEQQEASDIDVLVEFAEGADMFDLIGLGLFLEEKLFISLVWKLNSVIHLLNIFLALYGQEEIHGRILGISA